MPSDELTFDREFAALPGRPEQVMTGVRRILAPNPSPYTFTGTCTYIVGEGAVAIIDPGPNDERHLDAIVAALRGETVAQILVTHTHRDHSAASAALRERTGAPILAEGKHRSARDRHAGETPIEAGADRDFVPDRTLADGELLELDGYAIEVVATPGHTANHLAFALKGRDCLFSGDHVMAWSTSIIAPPDGSMTDYMRSLAKLRARPETVYLPGHGPPARDAHRLIERYIDHRLAREAAILRRLERGEADIPGLVQAIYIGLDPRLAGAAALTVLAHLEDLVGRGLVASDGPPMLSGTYRLARQREA